MIPRWQETYRVQSQSMSEFEEWSLPNPRHQSKLAPGQLLKARLGGVKHTWRFGRWNFPVPPGIEYLPHNLVANVQLGETRNRMNHLPEYHPWAKSHQLVLYFVVPDIIPSCTLSYNFGGTVCNRLYLVRNFWEVRGS